MTHFARPGLDIYFQHGKAQNGRLFLILTFRRLGYSNRKKNENENLYISTRFKGF